MNICKRCGVKFHAPTIFKAYCSPACKSAYWRATGTKRKPTPKQQPTISDDGEQVFIKD